MGEMADYYYEDPLPEQTNKMTELEEANHRISPTPQSKEATAFEKWSATDGQQSDAYVHALRYFDKGKQHIGAKEIFDAGQESMKAAAFTPEENGWVPFGTVWPEKNRLVLVWLDGLNMPFVAYRHDKAGDKNSPQFITPLFNSEEWGFKRPAITHWCDGLTSHARLSPKGE